MTQTLHAIISYGYCRPYEATPGASAAVGGGHYTRQDRPDRPSLGVILARYVERRKLDHQANNNPGKHQVQGHFGRLRLDVEVVPRHDGPLAAALFPI